MKSNEELIELLQTETTHIVKTNEQSLKHAKPILRTSHAEVIGLTIDIGKMCDRGWYHTSEHFTKHLDMADDGTNVGTANGTNDNC